MRRVAVCLLASTILCSVLFAQVSLGATLKSTSRLNSALIRAIIAHDTQLVRRLLDRGANPNATDDGRRTVPALVGDSGAITIEIGGWTALMWASAAGRPATTKLLLDHHAAVNVHDHDGKTALTIAAFSGYTEIIRMLLDHGANIEARETISEGANPLVLAATTGHANTVRLLLARGANPSAADGRRQTALMWAAVGGHKKIVQLLLEYGASPNAKDDQGKTVLDRVKDKPVLVSLLKKHGAKS